MQKHRSSDPRYEQEWQDVLAIAELLPEDQRQAYLDASKKDLDKKYAGLAVNGYAARTTSNDEEVQAAAQELEKWRYFASVAELPDFRYADISVVQFAKTVGATDLILTVSISGGHTQTHIDRIRADM